MLYLHMVTDKVPYEKGGAHTQHLLRDTLSYSDILIPEMQYLLSVGSPFFPFFDNVACTIYTGI